MNCGLNDDDHELLEPGPTAAPATCGSEKQCSKPTCGQACEDGVGSSCNRDQKDAAVQGSWVREDNAQSQSSACMKCKTARAMVVVRQREPLCQACLEAGVSGKVRALKSNKLLLPGDHVALAFSGGFSSQTLLCNVLGMRKDASTARKERGKIGFNLSVVHINEATAHGLSADAADAYGITVQTAAQRCGAGGPASTFHSVPLSDVFLWLDAPGPPPSPPPPQPEGSSEAVSPPPPGKSCSGEGVTGAVSSSVGNDGADEGAADGRSSAPPCAEASVSVSSLASAAGAEAREARLQALLQSVLDPTGREDLMQYLRTRLLAVVAGRMGAGKLLRGDTATGLAARVVADAAKGRGYSLPGGIQLLDARGLSRGEPVVLQPMREVTLKEAVFFCRLRGLQSVQLPYSRTAGERRSVNALASSFVDSLQVNLPSTIFTILRTAAALKPFPFNSLEVLAPHPNPLAAAAPAAAAAATAPATVAATAADACVSRAGTVPTDGGRASDGRGAAGGGRERGEGGVGAAPGTPACCALCRAPLTRREQEAMAAATAARSLRARGHRQQSADCPARVAGPGDLGGRLASSSLNGAGAGAAEMRCNGSLPSAAAGAGAALAVQQGELAEVVERGAREEGEEEEEEEREAPFCASCRTQVLFTPEESAGPSAVLGGSTVGGGIGIVDVAGSKTLALLPASFLR